VHLYNKFSLAFSENVSGSFIGERSYTKVYKTFHFLVHEESRAGTHDMIILFRTIIEKHRRV